MIPFEILSWVIGIIGLIGVIFTVYKYFRDPQISLDKTDAIIRIRLDDVEGHLKQVLENHLPHLETRIVTMQEQIAALDKSIVKLTTIIDERIPRK